MRPAAIQCLLLIGCLSAPAPAHAVAALHPLRDRLTDEAVARDQATFEAVATRLAVFDTASAPHSAYAHAEAEAWLALARDEYALNDRSGLCETAFDQAVALASALETRSATLQAPPRIIPGASRLREDLWQMSDSLKRTEALRCVAAYLGQLEVTLVRAGHEAVRCKSWEPHPFAAAAAQQAAAIRRKADDCVIPTAIVPAAAPALPEPGPATPPAHIVEALRRLGALNNVHFDLNADTISATSATVLDSVAAVMKAVPQIRATLIGHTDPRGSVAYNLALGRRRARAVYLFLRYAGIDTSRLSFGSEGKAAPVAIGNGIHEHALNRRVEIQYSAPGGVQLEVHHQERDLQLERSRVKPAAKPALKRKTGVRRKRRPALGH